MKLFNDLHYFPMSRIVLPLYIILPLVSFCPSIILPPLGNRLMIYAIYPCPLSFCPLDSFCPHIILPPYHFAPYHFAPWISFNVHYIPIPVSFCPYIFAPYNFAPYHFAPLEIVSWFTLFTHVQYHFAPWTHFAPISFCPLSFCPPENGLMIYTIYPCPVLFCPLH